MHFPRVRRDKKQGSHDKPYICMVIYTYRVWPIVAVISIVKCVDKGDKPDKDNNRE